MAKAPRLGDASTSEKATRDTGTEPCHSDAASGLDREPRACTPAHSGKAWARGHVRAGRGQRRRHGDARRPSCRLAARGARRCRPQRGLSCCRQEDRAPLSEAPSRRCRQAGGPERGKIASARCCARNAARRGAPRGGGEGAAGCARGHGGPQRPRPSPARPHAAHQGRVGGVKAQACGRGWRRSVKGAALDNKSSRREGLAATPHARATHEGPAARLPLPPQRARATGAGEQWPTRHIVQSRAGTARACGCRGRAHRAAPCAHAPTRREASQARRGQNARCGHLCRHQSEQGAGQAQATQGTVVDTQDSTQTAGRATAGIEQSNGAVRRLNGHSLQPTFTSHRGYSLVARHTATLSNRWHPPTSMRRRAQGAPPR